MADYWGVFVRYTRIQDSAPVNGQFPVLFAFYPNLYPYGFSANTGFEEHRTVIDFEAGRDIGIGDGSKLRALAGLRFAHYSSETNVLGSAIRTTTPYTPNFFTRQQFDGFGPRIGFSYSRPLSGMLELAAEGSAAGLWGRYKTNIADTFNGTNVFATTGGDSHDGWVGNLEGSIAPAYAPYGPRGLEVSLGIRGEAWFSQTDTNTFSANASSNAPKGKFTGPPLVPGQREDRFIWGPFARLKVPFGN